MGVAAIAVSGFDPYAWSSRPRRATPQARTGVGPAAPFVPDDDRTSDAPSESEGATPVLDPPYEPASEGLELATPCGPDDVAPTGDAVEDLRQAARRLIPLPLLPERRAQARIDALAGRLVAWPDGELLRTWIDELEADGHLDAAEGVLAALGRVDAGRRVLLEFAAARAGGARVRGAVFLALVQGVGRADAGTATAPRAEAYMRATVPATDPRVVEALRVAFDRELASGPRGGVERERLLQACGASGALDTDRLAAALRPSTVLAIRLPLTLALGRARDLGIAAPALRAAWTSDPERAVRRAAAAALARGDPTHADAAVRVVLDASRPGGERLDALTSLSYAGSRDPARVGALAWSLSALVGWAVLDPPLRDDDPMPDARSGPDVRSFDVPVRRRVVRVLRCLERAGGPESAVFADAAEALESRGGR